MGTLWFGAQLPRNIPGSPRNTSTNQLPPYVWPGISSPWWKLARQLLGTEMRAVSLIPQGDTSSGRQWDDKLPMNPSRTQFASVRLLKVRHDAEVPEFPKFKNNLSYLFDPVNTKDLKSSSPVSATFGHWPFVFLKQRWDGFLLIRPTSPRKKYNPRPSDFLIPSCLSLMGMSIH